MDIAQVFGKNIVYVIVSVLLTMGLQTGVNYMIASNGHVSVSKPMLIGDKTYEVVDIKNTSNKELNGLLLSVTANTNISAINSTNPLEMQRVKDYSSTNLRETINVSSIPNHAETSIFIPIKENGKNVLAMNVSNLNLDVVKYGKVTGKLNRAIRESAISALVYGIFLSIFSYWLSIKMKETHENLNKLKNKLDVHRKEYEELIKKEKEKHSDLIKRTSKIKATLLKDLKKYNNEIVFWRDTVRQFIYTHGAANRTDVDNFFIAISAALKTQSTHSLKQHKITTYDIERVIENLKEREAR